LTKPAEAQIENCRFYKETIDAIVAARTSAEVQSQMQKLFDIGQAPRCFAMFAGGLAEFDRASLQDFVRRFESSRPDKQSGGGAGATGSTSAVAHGPTARVLSVAAEYGALTQSVTGQVVTIRGNLGGLPSAIVRQNVFPYCMEGEPQNGYCVPGSLISILRRASFAVSFDTNRTNQTITGTPGTSAPAGNTAPVVTFTARKQEISSISGRLEIWNQRDVTSTEFREKWKQRVGAAMEEASTDLLETAAEMAEEVTDLPGYKDWYQQSVARITAPVDDRQDVVAELDAALEELLALVRIGVPNYRARAAAALAAYGRYFAAQDELIDSLATKSVVAFEYASNRPIGQPDLHNVRFIFDFPLNKQTKFVANSAFAFYKSVPEDARNSVKRFRDAQIGMQLDHALGRNSLSSAATVSIAGYFQYQNTPAVLELDPANPLPGIAFTGLPSNATTVFTRTGSIVLGQAKLTLVPGGSSAKIPISLTYSNRTELINKPTWRGQVGVTYDFDSLFSALAVRE